MAANFATFKRYALYVTPSGAPWTELAKAWLEAQLTDLPGLPLPLSEITETPRRYGLHATIVPPFHLAAPENGIEGIISTLSTFCAVQVPLKTGGLELKRLGRFLALTLRREPHTLNRLASSALELCDPFRAPLSNADLQRHLDKGLTPPQEALLRRWGYPYVRDAFRFHITLTAKLPKRTLPAIHDALEARLSPLLPEAWTVDHLSLVGEDAGGRFHAIERFDLQGS